MAKRDAVSPSTDGGASAVRICSLETCDLAANAEMRGGAGKLYCSPRHLGAAVARYLNMPTCPVCRRKFDPPSDHGRRPVYCSTRCKSARERELDRATRELAKDNGHAGSAGEALERAEMLYSAWRYDAGGADGWRGQNLAEKHWPGMVPPRLVPPSPKAVSALVQRISALHAQVSEERRARKRDEAKQQEAELDARVRGLRATEAEADRAWKADLLAASHVEQGGDDAA